MKYRVKNWKKYQHYKDRNPPWIKLHIELLSSEDWVLWDDASRVLAIAIMMLAPRNNGVVDASKRGLAYLQRVAYLNEPPDLNPLIDSGFLVCYHDASTMLASCYSETETETETEQNKTTSAAEPLPTPGRNGNDKDRPFSDWIPKAEEVTGRPDLVKFYVEELKRCLTDYYQARGGRLTPTRLGYIGKAFLRMGADPGMTAIEMFCDKHGGSKDERYLVGIARRLSKMNEKDQESDLDRHRAMMNGRGLWSSMNERG